MAIAESLLPEFDHEMATTRSLLERVPETEGAWVPHAKSMPLGRLAAHIAELVAWTNSTIQQTELDFGVPGAYNPAQLTTTAKLLELFDANVKSARAAIAGVSDADLMVPWTLRNGEHVIITMPRVAVLRSMVMNHVIHHRGQLSVYLRLHDVPLPSIYGPTADTQG
jgi:uncharacterized damage-inducible protein DinB